MEFLYYFVSIFPFWGIPLAGILIELGVYFKGRSRKAAMLLCLGTAGVLVILAVLYVYFGLYNEVGNALQFIYNKMLFSR